MYLYCGQVVGVIDKDVSRFLEPTRYQRQTVPPVLSKVEPHEFLLSQICYRESEREKKINFAPKGE